MNPRRDITDQVFGNVTALKYAYFDKEQEVSMWKVRCHICGGVKNKALSTIVNKKKPPQSCGCMRGRKVEIMT